VALALTAAQAAAGAGWPMGAIGGYGFFEADDLDAAIEPASRIPAARMGGGIDIRPMMGR
jgi:hypothetical protein